MTKKRCLHEIIACGIFFYSERKAEGGGGSIWMVSFLAIAVVSADNPFTASSYMQ
jgi:hypothetical protein